jgi:hypothetical protein
MRPSLMCMRYPKRSPPSKPTRPFDCVTDEALSKEQTYPDIRPNCRLQFLYWTPVPLVSQHTKKNLLRLNKTTELLPTPPSIWFGTFTNNTN